MQDVLEQFGLATREWFKAAFAAPTAAQPLSLRPKPRGRGQGGGPAARRTRR